MTRTIRCAAALCLVIAACGDDATNGSSTTLPDTSSTTAATTTTALETTTTEATTTTLATTTTAAVPGAYAVDYTGYCVRGTDPTDQLNVRTGPGGDFDVIGTLDFDAVGVEATGRAAPDGLGRPWFEIAFGGGTGWSAGWYLVPEPCDAAVASPAPRAGFLDALSGGLVPWEWVDENWVLFTYWPGSGNAYAMYLLSPQGDLYEVYDWDNSEITYFFMRDWRPDGQKVLVAADLVATADAELILLDLTTRTHTTIHTTDWANEIRASFTRPTGRDFVLDVNHPTRERIEVRRGDGTLFSVLVDRPDPGWEEPKTTWLYGLAGTQVVLGDATGLRLMDNAGNLIRNLDSPGANCRPIHWWDASTLVAGCTPQEVIDAVPVSIYSQLWRVPLSGAAATAITAAPSPIPDMVDFGYVDFVRHSGTIYAQWAGDCGAAGRTLIGARQDGIVVRTWTPCDDGPYTLTLVSVGGGAIRTLIPDGVREAIMIRDVP